MNKFLSLMSRMAENKNLKALDPLTFNGWTRGMPTQRRVTDTK